MMLLNPQAVLRDIGKLENEELEVTLPSIGTEAATVVKYINLAKQGHHAVMRAVRKVPFSYAQRCHLLAIEDLV